MGKKKFLSYYIILLILLLVPNNSKSLEIINQADQFEDFCDFKNQFETAPTVDKQQILDDYIIWQESKGFPAIINDTTVVFIVFNETRDDIDKVELFIQGGYIDFMIQLDSNFSLFYQELNYEPSTRLNYGFVYNENDDDWSRDYRNPKLSIWNEMSALEMPKFIPPIEIHERSEIPKGVLVDIEYHVDFYSWVYRPYVQVYLPNGYDTTKEYPVVYAADGYAYRDDMNVVTILDNLIADKIIEPLIFLFLDPYWTEYQDFYQRHAWYYFNSEYIQYLENLVSLVDLNYATSKSPYDRLHLGFSLSGLATAHVGYEMSDTFKLLGINSGSFQVVDDSINHLGYDLFTAYQECNTSRDYNFWLNAGTYEDGLFSGTKEFQEIIHAQGWKYDAVYLHDGHAPDQWRHTINDMLYYFFPGSNVTGAPEKPLGFEYQPTSSVTGIISTETSGGTSTQDTDSAKSEENGINYHTAIIIPTFYIIILFWRKKKS